MKAAAAASAGIQSMTGFAQARIERDGWSLRVNLRSVNHRFLDLHLRMPEGFEVFEPRIRLAIRNRLRRGHVDVNVYYEAAGPASVEVNRDVAEAYMKAVEELREQFGVKTEPDLIALFRLPGVVAAPGATGSGSCAACGTQRRHRGARSLAQPRGAIPKIACRHGRSGQETRFPAAGNAAGSQHFAFQDSGYRV